ncbi:hypothetical protein LWI28_017025 [Acer negundo]|uniref:Uncharacterized protein n=1 Tax=Acer negundo TaxID=4023 RepID=A0AAD5J607_ACENE|nr:hypothetical protein LWI28_017025 [Acer negundo]KAK4851780.1 hypothetical protein QYF36_018379 [Acer negundo]
MEVLWNPEDKWKLTIQQTILLLGCASFLVIGLLTATILKKAAQRKKTTEDQDEATNRSLSIREKWPEPGCNWVSIKRMLMGSVKWSRASKWEERSTGSWRERISPLLGSRKEGHEEGGVGWQSHSHDLGSPVWQRPILMGEKCELPRFSGLILYDETGRLLEHSLKEASQKNNIHQEKCAAVRTTLRDLL